MFPNVSGVVDSIGAIDAHRALPEAQRAKTTPAGMLQMFLLYRYGVATMDRASFGKIGAEGQHFLRLSTANSLDEIKRGVALIEQGCADAAGFERFAEEEGLWS